MSVITKDLGAATAYGYAVEKGYTGTEEEFAELMASYATVGQTAVDAKDAAVAAKTAAQTAATTATNKASEATTAAQTATAKAGEASTSASTATSAKDTAVSASQTATSKATEATTAAATATSAASTATTAKDDAVSAKTAAQTAQTGAETAAASVQSSAAQIQTNKEDINELKEDLNATNTELVDIRVGADSTTYASAGAAVRGQVNDLRADISKFNDNITRENFTWASDFNIGKQLFDISNGTPVASAYKNGYRVATNYQSPIYLEKGSSFVIPSDRTLRYAYSADGVTYALNAESWIYGEAVLTLPKNGYYIFLISSNVNGTIDTVQIESPIQFASRISFYYPKLGAIDVLNDSTLSFESWKIGFSNGTIDVNSNGWTILPYKANSRITSDIDNPFRLYIGDVVSIPDGYTVYPAYRDLSGVYHVIGTWFTGSYTVETDGYYVLCIRNTSDTELSTNIQSILNPFRIKSSRMFARKHVVTEALVENDIRHSYLESIARLGYDIAKDSTPPEQSIESYKEAYRHGYRIMLTDIRWTSDLVPVAVHDATINAVARNADGTAISDSVAVSSSSLAELDAYDFGIIKGDKYAGLKVMRIADFVPLCKKLNCEMYLEIKNLEGTIADISDAKLDSLKIILDKYNIGNKCTFIVESDRVANKIHAVYPKARIGLTYTSNLVGEQLTKRINWLLNVKSENDVFLYLYDETVMTGQVSDDLIDVCTINDIGIEYTEIKTLTQLNTWLTDNNNLYCNRVAIRVKPIEYSLIDVLVSES